MRKILVLTLFALLAIVAFGARSASAQEPKQEKEKTAVAKKEARWHGTLVRMNKDESTMQVRKGTIERTIHFNESTQWTEGKKVIAMSDVKDGADIICLGKFDEKGNFQATRVDLRRD